MKQFGTRLTQVMTSEENSKISIFYNKNALHIIKVNLEKIMTYIKH